MIDVLDVLYFVSDRYFGDHILLSGLLYVIFYPIILIHC